MAGKRDDLNGTCDDEYFAQRGQAENSDLRAAAKFFDGNGMQTRHDDAGFDPKRYGERQSRNQGAQLNALSSCVEYYGQGQNTEHLMGIVRMFLGKIKYPKKLKSKTLDRWVGIALAVALVFGAAWLAFGFATTDVYSASLWRGHSYWPLVYLCAVVSLTGALLLGFVERSVAALLPAIGTLALIAFGPAAIVSTVAVVWVGYVLGELVIRKTPESVDDPVALFARLALGLLVLALVLNVAIAFPIHEVRIYSVAFLILVCARWRASIAMVREIRALWSLCRGPLGLWSAIAAIAMGVLVCVQIVEAAFPERQHDALSMHLLIAQTVQTTGQWHFAGDFLAGANQPLMGDWLFSVMFVVAGESGAKLLNYAVILLAAAMVHMLTSEQFGRGPATAATIVLLSSPFTFLEAAGVSLDNFLLMSITTGLAVCGLWPKLSPRERVLSGAVVMCGIPSAKLHGVFASATLLVLLLSQRVWRDVRAAGVQTTIVGLIILALGAAPFLIAFAVTGNPVFPYFNAVFASPYFAVWNFAAAYPSDVAPSILHRLTFHTSRHVQGADGTLGFQFVVFLIPGIIATLARPKFLSVTALVITLAYSIGVLFMTADARYFYPVFPAFSVVIAQCIFLIQRFSRGALSTAALAVAGVVGCLNFLYFPGARWTLLPFSPIALIDAHAREEMIRLQVPQRLLIDQVNNTYGTYARVVFVGQPVGFPLWGTPLFANWYMPGVYQGMVQAATDNEVAEWLSSLGATHVIFSAGEQFANVNTIRRFLWTKSKPLMALNGQTLFEISDDVRFKTVLSPVGSWDKWSLAGADMSPDGLRITPGMSISFATRTLTQNQRNIRLTGRASCDDDRAEVFALIQWHPAKDTRSVVASKTFTCANGVGRRFSAEFDRPRDAATATVSLTTGGPGAARISEASVATTEITVAEPSPLFRRDWAASPVWVKLGYIRRLIPVRF